MGSWALSSFSSKIANLNEILTIWHVHNTPLHECFWLGQRFPDIRVKVKGFPEIRVKVKADSVSIVTCPPCHLHTLGYKGKKHGSCWNIRNPSRTHFNSLWPGDTIWQHMGQTDSTDKSTFVPVMAWCHQVPSHYLSQCWTRSVLPYSVTGPQWVKMRFG